MDIVEFSRLILSQLQARACSGGAHVDAQRGLLAVLEIQRQGIFARIGYADHVLLLLLFLFVFLFGIVYMVQRISH
jgi:hypothetical protein